MWLAGTRSGSSLWLSSSAKARIFSSVEDRIQFHSDISTLVRFRGGERSSHSNDAARVHSANYDTCRSDSQQRNGTLLAVRRDGDPSQTAATWAGIHSRIQQWKASHASLERRAEAERSLVASQVSAFLGIRATRRVLEPVYPDNHNLLSLLEPVLGEFLGRGAAATLVNHVVDTAIVKI